jgi:hypothetical protein
MKRAVVALGVGIIIFSGIYGMASSLGVTSQSLGSGNASVAACQATTLTSAFATVYDAALPGYKVGVVTVTGLDTTAGKCASKAFKVSLVNASNVSLGEILGTTPTSGTSFTADFTTSGALASNVTGVHVLITG